MMAKPRITIQVTEKGGPTGNIEMFLNPAGMMLLLEELNALCEQDEHFHLFAPQWGNPDGPLRLTPYDSGTPTAGHLKVMLRPDDWDQEHFPDVFAAHQKEKCEGVDD